MVECRTSNPEVEGSTFYKAPFLRLACHWCNENARATNARESMERERERDRERYIYIEREKEREILLVEDLERFESRRVLVFSFFFPFLSHLTIN